jgi:hypothetical protein
MSTRRRILSLRQSLAHSWSRRSEPEPFDRRSIRRRRADRPVE